MHLMTLTLSALLLETSLAARCGSMTMTKCSDDQCSQNCVTTEMVPQECGNSYIGQVTNSGSYAAGMCDNYKLTYKFFGSNNCVGDQKVEVHAYYYNECTLTDTGSVKIVPSGDQPQFFELTEAEYEERFNQRWFPGAESNILGYGLRNVFVPPLFQPTWLLSEFDRFQLTITSLPFAPFF